MRADYFQRARGGFFLLTSRLLRMNYQKIPQMWAKICAKVINLLTWNKSHRGKTFSISGATAGVGGPWLMAKGPALDPFWKQIGVSFLKGNPPKSKSQLSFWLSFRATKTATLKIKTHPDGFFIDPTKGLTTICSFGGLEKLQFCLHACGDSRLGFGKIMLKENNTAPKLHHIFFVSFLEGGA